MFKRLLINSLRYPKLFLFLRYIYNFIYRLTFQSIVLFYQEILPVLLVLSLSHFNSETLKIQIRI